LSVYIHGRCNRFELNQARLGPWQEFAKLKKPVIGLTGGIASGKSTVGKIFTELGITVIDADQLARDVVSPGAAGLVEVLTTFGQEFRSEDGTLNRPKLGRHIFGDEAARKQLNSLLHPRILKLYEERVAAAQDTSTPYIIYESALLVELELYRKLARLIVVATAPELQLTRVMKRNQLTEAEARDRLGAQFPLEKKVAVADYVIVNDNDQDALRVRTLGVHEQLMQFQEIFLRK
jgi:dephospho-CoA kinase